MNHEDDWNQDYGWADPEGSRILAETLIAMADGVDPYSPTGPAANVRGMAGSVRRRRAAKLGAAGGGALAVAALLVFGGPQLVPDGDAAPVLPGNPSPSSRATEAPERSAAVAPRAPRPVPVDGAQLRIDEAAEQPPLLRGTRLRCGESWSRVGTSFDTRLELSGLTSTASWYEGEWYFGERAAVRAVDAAGGPVVRAGLQWPNLVWTTRAGTVVDLGSGWETPDSFTNTENTSGVTEAWDDRSSECLDSKDGALPDGTYQVRAVSVEDGTLVASEPVAVTIVAGERFLAGGGLETAEPLDLPQGPDAALLEQGGINSVVLDRTGEYERLIGYVGDWAALEKTVARDVVFEVRGSCSVAAGVTEARSVGLTVRGSFNGAIEAAERIRCDGREHATGEYVHSGIPFSADGDVGLYLTQVPDDVAQANVRLVPAQAPAPGPTVATAG
ncbi:hypothetical protein [Myceligenerans crystallogenes]|uniref:Uncharacterized protein n=1 Tax=Myceligenerans crystallogenes TaxID=316335 RepID=A0ABP4ZQD6_9MICO